MNELQILNIFPLQVEHKEEKFIQHERGFLTPKQVLKSIEIYDDCQTLLKACIDNRENNLIRNTVEKKLDESPMYRFWQKSMPFLKDVPQIHKYRNNYHKCDCLATHDEIIKHGMYLRAGQVLFRGGNFNDEKFQITNGPISTSLLPDVALWHTLGKKREVAILKVGTEARIKAFIFSTRGNQNLTQEHEVLLQSHLSFEQTNREEYNEHTIVEYEINNIV